MGNRKKHKKYRARISGVLKPRGRSLTQGTRGQSCEEMFKPDSCDVFWIEEAIHETTKETTEMLNGFIRDIVNRTVATGFYDDVTRQAVEVGCGAFRILTQKSEDNPSEQDIIIELSSAVSVEF